MLVWAAALGLRGSRGANKSRGGILQDTELRWYTDEMKVLDMKRPADLLCSGDMLKSCTIHIWIYTCIQIWLDRWFYQGHLGKYLFYYLFWHAALHHVLSLRFRFLLQSDLLNPVEVAINHFYGILPSCTYEEERPFNLFTTQIVHFVCVERSCCDRKSLTRMSFSVPAISSMLGVSLSQRRTLTFSHLQHLLDK